MPEPLPTIADIAVYQVSMWTGIGLALALLAAVMSIVFMDVGRDPVLYSQFKNENDAKSD